MDADRWAEDLPIFSKELIANLFSRHPVLCSLSHKLTGSLIFHDDIGKSVLLSWQKRRNELDQNLEIDFPAFIESEHCFKEYLKRYVDVEIQSEHSVFSQIIELSAMLLEILFFIYRKGIVKFLCDAPSYLSFMLFNVTAEEFYKEGGWLQLIALSAELSENYDDEVCKQNISEYVRIRSASDETKSINSNLETLKEKSLKLDSSMSQSKVELYSPNKKSLTEGTEKHSTEVISVLNKSEEEINRGPSGERIFSEVKEISKEIFSTLNKPDNELKKDQTSNEATPEKNKENSLKVISPLSKSENELLKDPSKEETTQVKDSQEVQVTEGQEVVEEKQDLREVVDVKDGQKVAVQESENDVVEVQESEQDVAKVQESERDVAKVQESERDVAKVHEHSQVAEVQEHAQEVAEVKEQELVEVKEQEVAEVKESDPEAVEVKDNVLDSVSVSKVEFLSTDSSNSSYVLSISQNISESLKTEETIPPEDRKPSLDDNISCEYTTHSTSPIDSELAKEVDKFLIDEITTHFHVRFLSEEEIEAINSLSEDDGKKDCNIQALKQDGAVQADLMSLNINQNISTLMNPANSTILAQKKRNSAEHIFTSDDATKNQILFKSPKPESNKRATPNKAKTPLAEKSVVKDVRGKTTASDQNQSVTPLKTQTGTPKSPIVSSEGKNMREEKTPIKLKSNVVSSKSSSQCFKTPTDKGISKVHSKSCEKIERNQILSSPKVLVEMTKSSPISASGVNTKSRRGEISDSSKPTIVVHPISGEKDTSSITSKLIPQDQVSATDKPIASKNRKSTNTKSENCQKSGSREKTSGSALAKSTDQSESKTPKTSEESLTTKSCKSSSCIKTCDQTKTISKSTVSNTARRRNVPEKNTSSDPKSEKPRWR